MNLELKESFLTNWRKYFGNSDLPIVFWYTYADGGTDWAEKPKGWSCIICELAKVRNGRSLVFNAERQRAVIGMFDPSARKCVPENIMTFAVPMKRFERIIGYME